MKSSFNDDEDDTAWQALSEEDIITNNLSVPGLLG